MPNEVSFNIDLLACNDQTYWHVWIKCHDTDTPERIFEDECESFNEALLAAARAVSAELQRINSRSNPLLSEASKKELHQPMLPWFTSKAG